MAESESLTMTRTVRQRVDNGDGTFTEINVVEKRLKADHDAMVAAEKQREKQAAKAVGKIQETGSGNAGGGMAETGLSDPDFGTES